MSDTPITTQPETQVQGALPTESKSQRRIVWEQFRKHKAALIGGGILIIMYLLAAFGGFLAPYGMNEYRRNPSAA